MSQAPSSAETAESDSVPAPPLQSGDRLTRDEFERRFASSPSLKKAELIEGIVLLPSPVPSAHGDAHAKMVWWLTCFQAARGDLIVSDNPTLRLDPEAMLRGDLAAVRAALDAHL